MERSDDIQSKEKIRTSGSANLYEANLYEANSGYLIDLEPIPPPNYFDYVFKKNLQGFLESQKAKAKLQSHTVAPTSLLDDDFAPAEAPGGKNGLEEVVPAPGDGVPSTERLESKATNGLVSGCNPYDLYSLANRFPSPELPPSTDTGGTFDGRAAAIPRATDKIGESLPADFRVNSQKTVKSNDMSSVVPIKPLTTYRLDIPEALLPELRRDPRFTGYCHAWIYSPDFCVRGGSCIFRHQFPPGTVKEFGITLAYSMNDSKTTTGSEEEASAGRAGPGRTHYLNPGAEEFTPGCYNQACIAFLTTGFCRHDARCWYQHLDHRQLHGRNSPAGTRSRYQTAETPFLLPLRTNSPTEIQRRHQVAETSFPLPLRANSPAETRGHSQAAETPIVNRDTNGWDAFVTQSLSEFNATQIANGLELSIHRPRNSNRVGRNATLTPRNSYGGQTSTSWSTKVGRTAMSTPRSTYDARTLTNNFDDVIHIAVATPRRYQVASLNTSTPARRSNGASHTWSATSYNPSDVINIAKTSLAQKTGPSIRNPSISTTPEAPPPNVGETATNDSLFPAISPGAPVAAIGNLLDRSVPAMPMSDVLAPTRVRAEILPKHYTSWDDAPNKDARDIDFWAGQPAIVVDRPAIVASEAQAKSYVVAASPAERPAPQVVHLGEIDKPAVQNTRVSPFDRGWEKLIDL